MPVGNPIRSILGKQKLQRSTTNGRYYLIEKGERRAVPNLETLIALGYSGEEVEDVPEDQLQGTEGYPVPDLSEMANHLI